MLVMDSLLARHGFDGGSARSLAYLAVRAAPVLPVASDTAVIGRRATARAICTAGPSDVDAVVATGFFKGKIGA